MNKLFQKIKQLFCKHEYHWCREEGKIDKFCVISGETYYLVCSKCGKIKDTMFSKYQ